MNTPVIMKSMAIEMDPKKNIKKRAEGHACYSSRNCVQYDKPKHCPSLRIFTLNFLLGAKIDFIIPTISF